MAELSRAATSGRWGARSSVSFYRLGRSAAQPRARTRSFIAPRKKSSVKKKRKTFQMDISRAALQSTLSLTAFGKYARLLVVSSPGAHRILFSFFLAERRKLGRAINFAVRINNVSDAVSS